MAPGAEREVTRSERYRARSRWSDATRHVFLDHWARGTLPEPAFARYIVQDYLYVQALVPLVGRLYVEAPSIASRQRYRQFLMTLLTDEDRYFAEVLESLGLSSDPVHAPAPHPLTARFVAYLLRLSRSENYGTLMAPLVASEWVYWDWASRLSRDPPEHPLYRRWVELHSDEGFSGFVAALRAELDELVLTPDQDREAESRFVTVVDFEARFWDMAWSGTA